MKRISGIPAKSDIHLENMNDCIEQNTSSDEVLRLAALLFLSMFSTRAREKKLMNIITDLIQANRTLEENCKSLRDQAVKDPLTGLFNRRYMRATLVREAHRILRRGSTLGFVMIDVDHFKQVNDTHGHDVGDEVLRALGKFFQKHTRVEDIACRYGGEEFLLVLPDIGEKDLFRRAEQIREGIREKLEFESGGKKFGITVSMGVTLFENSEDDIKDTIKRADRALYEAKNGGRDRVVASGQS